MSQQMDLFNEVSPPPDEKKVPADENALEALREISVQAHEAALYAGMAGLSFEAFIGPFVRKVLEAAQKAGEEARAAGRETASVQLAEREAACRTSLDRGDPNVRIVLEAAYKTGREIHRVLGFLRFSPVETGTPPEKFYVASCAPDNFILPAIGEHFSLRFGETPWAVIDEKRALVLIRRPGEETRLEPFDGPLSRRVFPETDMAGSSDLTENFWRLYNKSITIENRRNLKLQSQFVPLRYRKYLPEFKK